MKEQDKIWKLRTADQELVNKLVDELDITPITAKILVNRGYDDIEQIIDFLDCSIEKMHDPYLFNEMETAVQRINQAVEKQEKIVVYGDYDVDGITSTALLLNYLQNSGAQIDFYIPNRLKEGYGMNQTALRKLAEQDVDLLITVDCGIKAQQEVELAKNLGMDVIITDHHTVPSKLPPAVAVINPKREDSQYPFAELAGVVVAFKLIQALEIANNDAVMPAAREYLAIVSLGVVADIVPLRDENRIIADRGMKQLKNLTKEQPGLFALAEVTGCLDTEISTGHIAFGLAPRINACGRLGAPELGVELLLSQNYEEAQELAQELDDLNDQRQELSQKMQEEAEALIEQLDLEENRVLVLASKNWHSGVIGNVASDLNEKYHRPVILIALEENNVGQGSARSISGFNIHDALLAQEELLIAFGGHEQAAGLSIEAKNISLLQDKLNQYAQRQLTEQDLLPQVKADAAVNLNELSFALVQELDALAPFGCANPSPKLIVEDVKIREYKLVGSSKKHLKFTAQDSDKKVDGIAFSQPDSKAKLDIQAEDVSLLFSPEINCWRGNKKLQLKVKDIKVPFDSEIDQIFVKDESERETESKATHFIKVVKSEKKQRQQLIKELTPGEELTLSSIEKDNGLRVEVVTRTGKSVGYLPEKWNSLARKLDVGVNYQAWVAEIVNNTGSKLFLRILVKKTAQKEYQRQEKLKETKAELMDKSKLESLNYLCKKLYNNSQSDFKKKVTNGLLKGKNILSIINPSQNKDELSLGFAAWKAVQQKEISILIYPFNSILEQRFPIITSKLEELGLQTCKATSLLTDSEEISLQAKLENEQCDLLVTTPQFLKTNIIGFEKIKSQVGLLILEEINYFINEPWVGLLTNIISQLNQPQLLGYTSAITKVEVTEILKKFNFDKHIVSNYNKVPLKLKDNRNLNDKISYLKQQLNCNQQTVVYVTNAEKSQNLSQKLRKNSSNYKNRIAYYNEKMDNDNQNLIREKFSSEELTMLIATPAFNETWGLKNIAHIIFYEPCFNSYNFKYLANQAGRSDSGVLHLLYKAEEIEENKELLKQLVPNRELLKELYVILFKNKNKAGEVTIKQEKILYKLNNCLSFQISNSFLLNCLNIFEDLKLLQRNKGKGGKIKLLDKPEQKLDLCTSMRYNECVILEEVFSYLENLTKKEGSKLLKSITETYLTTLKGEKNIESSR